MKHASLLDTARGFKCYALLYQDYCKYHDSNLICPNFKYSTTKWGSDQTNKSIHTLSWQNIDFLPYRKVSMTQNYTQKDPLGDCCTNTSYTQVQNREFQNWRMVVVGKYLWKLSSSSPLLKQVHLVHVAQYRQVLNISTEGDYSLGNLSECSVTLKDFFLILRANFLCFHLGLMSLIMLLGTTDKCLDSSSWHSALRHLYASIRYLLIFLQTKQSQIPQPFLIREMIYLFPSHLHSPPLGCLK